MESSGCDHSDLEYLGEQKADVGTNKYFRCRICKGVIIISADSKSVYYVKGKE